MDKQLLRDFCHHQTCPTRGPERNTKHRKEQVPVTAKANQLAKTKNIMQTMTQDQQTHSNLHNHLETEKLAPDCQLDKQ